jgi:GrpB-like predicted nucleotidyltransferase (UPF0157 family)
MSEQGSPRIVIAAYDDRWPAAYRELEALLRGALGDLAVRIDHIGSTSVPGLAAKDVIDIQVSVARLDDPGLAPAFERLGAVATGIAADHVPPGQHGNPADWAKRYFRPPPGWRPTHLHVRQVGRANQRYALLFRDYLRQAPDAAAAYATIKQALARRNPDDVEAYYDVKDPVCDLVMDAAERWAEQVGWSP